MPAGFPPRTALLPDGPVRPVGAAGQPRVTPSSWPARRATFGLSSLLLHLLAIGLLSCVIAKLAPPDRSQEASVEMVFEAAPAGLPPPEELPEPVAEAQPPPPPDMTPPDTSPPDLSPPPEPSPAPAMEHPPPRPKPPPRPTPRIVRPQPALQPAEPAPASAPVTAPAAAQRPPAVDPGWQSSVASWLASHKNYSDDARRRGDLGRVVIRFTVDRSGHVLDAEVVSSAGSSRLDDATLAMLRGATLPAFPPTMTNERGTVTTSVRYTLR